MMDTLIEIVGKDARLTNPARYIFVYLTAMKRGEPVELSQRSIARNLGMSSFTVRKAMRLLREAGYVEGSRKPGGEPTRYTIRLPKGVMR